MKKFLMIVLVMFYTTLLFSQTDTTNIYFPDRPGFGAPPQLVGLYKIDYETSFGYCSNYTYKDYNSQLLYNTNLVRFGLMKHLELRAEIDLGHLFNNDNSVKGLNFGVKIPIVKNLKYLPDIGILGQLGLPKIGDSEILTPKYSPQILLLLQKGIGKFLLISNVGVFFDGVDNSKTQGICSLAVCYNLTQKLGSFVEIYRVGSYGTYEDLGLNYFITDNLQVDISYSNQYGGTTNGGLAWRFKH